MKKIYLVGVGTYSQREIVCALTSEDEAGKYRTHYEQHPPRSLGPTSPIWVLEIDLYDTADEAIEGNAP